ncbi:hypothetical protein mRhiFer1_001730 [Rhinolophus ferrumequinum]|uniref:Uncharacterized protein n=1 Tax=Rhinolophus ferrumequinum TaxID=59479 RepID=A0A7J7SGT2_RHIFE|nr:hypothetical protein mRhiFer1_001730 [Rhinolophus ferrumequinum]
MMCPAPSAIHGEPLCCECQARFRGHLPMPRTEAALPYWVPPSLRPQKKIQKRIRLYIPKIIKACPCTCHCFGGRLPMPRDRAMMPYWVPQVLRSHNKMARRQQSFAGIQETSWDPSACYNCWRICDRRLLFKWQQLQPRHQERRLALGSGASPQVLLLPLSLLTLLQAILRVIAIIRQFFLV